MVRRNIDTILPIAVREAVRELGQVLVASRREQGITQLELAKRVGVNRATIGRIESGGAGVAVGWGLPRRGC